MLIADIPYPLHTKSLMGAEALSLAYADEGEGFPVLFIHGLGSSIPAWQKNIPILSKYFRCLALDLPGYGKSAKEGFAAGMEFYADVVNGFLGKLHISACYLVGHSMGGQVAIHTASKYPEKVKKLALMAPAGLETFKPEEGQQLKQWFAPEKVFAAGADIIEQNVKANFHHFPADAQTLLQERVDYKSCHDYRAFCQVVSDSVAAMLNEPVHARLSTLSMPVLMLFGRQDAYIPSKLLHPGLELETMLQEAQAFMPNLRYHLIDSCGHFVQWEQAEQVNKYLLEFLKGSTGKESN